MLQTIVKTFNNSDEINDEAASIEYCKYCSVKDIRILEGESTSLIRAQILYDYDIDQYNKDLEDEKNKTP